MALRVWKHDKLQMGSVIPIQDGSISSLDFNKAGDYLVMSTKESSIHLIDALAGVERKKIYTKSHGIGTVKYTHHNYGVLVSSERKSHDIRYLSLYDNRYLRFYSGHSDFVVSLSMNPTEDYFISSSLDNTVCLWSLCNTSPIAKLQIPSNCERPFVAYDAAGLIFGVLCYDSSTKSHRIKLFDARSYDAGPFQDIAPDKSLIEATLSKNLQLLPSQTQRALQAQWSSFEFSPDGQKILVNTTSDLMLVLDSFSSSTEPVAITGRKNDIGMNLGACFSADAQSIVTGNDDNELQVYDTFNGEMRGTLTGHVAPVGCVKCNPRYDIMAAGCVNLALWIQSSKE